MSSRYRAVRPTECLSECAPIAVRRLEKRHNLLKLALCLIDARDIIESDAGVFLDIHLGVALTDRGQAAQALAVRNVAEHEHPNRKKQSDRDDP